ncbi:MAG: SusC/RagA family TonB-linked outer membrane protein [Prevotellaceae bacterium]|jgi:TonB-linked SusC/RagA family outer membrane protein|nr:SusC/RagA family TonB-linked outer membrane protein [Prevotellaceae bacterium]
MKKIILITLLLLVGAGLSFAQQRVTGKVTSKDDGLPIPFATVTAKGTTAVATTNDNGEYGINVPEGATTLTVSFIGMVSQDVEIAGRSIVDVVLESEGEMLTESVVTAMGIKKEKKALGYTVSDINSDELMKNKQTNVINSLAGKIPGVNITQSSGAAGAGSSITIRGGNSASESRDNQPLFVVDGIVFDNTTTNTGNSGTDGVTRSATTFSNRVMDINPEDIESMSVLKGAAAAALYGSRAADGVVIITTKKGSEGVLRVNLSNKYTYSWVNRLPDQQGAYGRGYYNESGAFSAFTTGLESWGEPIAGTVYNNVEDFFQRSNIFDNSVSVSGGTQNGTFYISASNYDQEGIVPGTSYKKNTFRLNAEQKYGIVTVGANAAYSQANSTKTLTSTGLYGQGGAKNGSSGAMSSLYIWPRSDDMAYWLNADGTKSRMYKDQQDLEDDIENPYWIINKNSLKDATYRFNGGANVNVKLTDWWDITGRAGIDRYNLDSYTYQAPGAALKTSYQKGTLSKGDITYQYLTAQFLSNMQKRFGDFEVGLLLGTSTEDTKTLSQSHWGYRFMSEGTIGFKNIPTNQQYFSDATVRKRLVGVFGEFRVSYKSLAYLTVTGRNDWSSTLPVENRSYFYPSVSGSFVFTELLPKNDILSFGKIRGSWARVGKDADPYALSTYLWPIATLNGGVYGAGDQWTGGSPKLKPEIQDSWEVGLEMRFFGGRLGLDYTYYSKKTKNQICAPRLGQSTGYIFLTLNGGSVTGEGMELAITGKPIVTKDFQWEASLNLSGNRTRLGDFVDGVSIFYVTDAQQGGAKAGSEPNGGYFYGLTGDYFLRENDANGEEMSNGRYIIDPKTGLYKRTNVETNMLANREPKMIGGFNNSFTYKNLNLSFLWDIRVGGAVYNGTERTLMMKGLSANTANRESISFSGVVENGSGGYDEKTITYNANETYTIDGKARSGRYMIQEYYKNEARNAYNFITDTNWLRLRSISVSYNFKDLLKNQKVIKGLTATVSANNLILITNYKGLDPEVTSAGAGTGGSGSMGMDYLGVPAIAGVSFGVNVTF